MLPRGRPGSGRGTSVFQFQVAIIVAIIVKERFARLLLDVLQEDSSTNASALS